MLTREFNRKIRLRGFIVGLFLLSHMVFFSLQTPFWLVMSYVTNLAMIVYSTNGSIRIPRTLYYWSMVFVYIAAYSVITFNHGITPLFYLINFPVVVLAGYMLTKLGRETIYFALSFLVYSLLLIISYFVWEYRYSDDILAQIIPWASRNGITSSLLVVLITYNIISYNFNQRIAIIPSLVTAVICVIGLGRGSIVVSLLNLFLVLYISFRYRLNHRAKLLLLGLLFSLIVINSAGLKRFIEKEVVVYIQAKSQFSQGYTDSNRAGIIKEYFGKVNVLTFLTGASFTGTIIADKYDSNPHNSYLRAHAFFGLPGLVMVGFLLYSVILAGSSSKIMPILALLLFLRAITEPIFFPTPLDLYIWIIYFVLKT